MHTSQTRVMHYQLLTVLGKRVPTTLQPGTDMTHHAVTSLLLEQYTRDDLQNV